MEILDLRHFRSRDLDTLLDEERNVWQGNLQWDYSACASLIRRYLDSASLAGYAVMDSGSPLGYCFYIYENYKGEVGDVFVRDSPAAREAEQELLLHLFDTLRGTPGIRRIEAQLMMLRHEPPAELVAREDFKHFRRQHMALPLQNVPLPAKHEIARIRVELWDQRWLEQAAGLIERAYRGHIDSSISDQYRSHSGALRFLDNVIHYPGCGDFDGDCSFLAFRNDTAQLCGMALSSVVGPGVSHITQICVDPSVQSHGIGRMLMVQIIQRLQERMANTVTLTVTKDNRAAISLYEQLHFTTVKEFPAFSWETPQR